MFRADLKQMKDEIKKDYSIVIKDLKKSLERKCVRAFVITHVVSAIGTLCARYNGGNRKDGRYLDSGCSSERRAVNNL